MQPLYVFVYAAVCGRSSVVEEQVDDDERNDRCDDGRDDLRYGNRRLACDLTGLAVDYEIVYLAVEPVVRDPDRR